MLGLAWATLPDLPGYRTGVIMVGLARCIAMVMIWNDLARGDAEYGAILVIINAVLQIILFSPFAVLFINIIGGKSQIAVHVAYGDVAISVLIVSLQIYRISRNEHCAFVVSWHSPCGRCYYSIHHNLSYQQRILGQKISPSFLTFRFSRSSLHYHNPICLSRTPNSSRPRSRIPCLRSSNFILPDNVDVDIFHHILPFAETVSRTPNIRL